jgi:type I restriction enzyme S subunit
MSDWRSTRLGDEIELAYGKALPARVRHPGEIPVYGSNGLVGVNDGSLVRGPGIVVGRKGSVGALAFSRNPFWPIDTTYYVVNKAEHSWRFLYHLLQTCGLTDLNSHSAVPGLNREDVYAIAVAIPDRAEQDAIARALDCLEDAEALEETALADVQKLKTATMERVFRTGLRREPQTESDLGDLPTSWQVERLGAHHSVVSGGTPSRSNPEFWDGGTIPWVKTAEVDYGLITSTSEHITQGGLDGSAAKMLPAGTVLMAMYGQGVTRGRVAVLGIDATCNQACAAIIAIDGSVIPRYLFHFTTWRYVAIRALAHGGQQQNLNLDIVRDLQIAYPMDIEEQSEIVGLLDALDEKIHLHRQKCQVLQQLLTTVRDGLVSRTIELGDVTVSIHQQLAEGSAA